MQHRALRTSRTHWTPPTDADGIAAFVTDLLDVHRAVLGDARMDGEGDGDGAEPDADGDADADDGDQDSDQDRDDDAKDLGDAGKKALERMKARDKASRAQVRDLKAQLAAKDKPPADDDKPDAEAIRKQAREEARAEVDAERLAERVNDKIETRAAKDFADPEDAVALLLRSNDIEDLTDDGKPDVEAIDEALKALLKKKPHLAAAQRGKGRFTGGGDQGDKGDKTPPKPKSLHDAVTARFKPGGG